jgi:hypothetical protein
LKLLIIFEDYGKSRRTKEKAQVDSRPNQRVDGLPRLLEILSAKIGRATRGLNKRSIREVKRLGGFPVKVKITIMKTTYLISFKDGKVYEILDFPSIEVEKMSKLEISGDPGILYFYYSFYIT